jgi:hypothetical protein
MMENIFAFRDSNFSSTIIFVDWKGLEEKDAGPRIAIA